MLYSRSTKTRSVTLDVKSFEVTKFTADKFEPAIKLTAKCDDGKERSLIFYGNEIASLEKQINRRRGEGELKIIDDCCELDEDRRSELRLWSKDYKEGNTPGHYDQPKTVVELGYVLTRLLEMGEVDTARRIVGAANENNLY